MAGRGGKRPGAGRPKGSQNKVTQRAREVVTALVDATMPKVQGWLDEIYEEKGAQAALDSFKDLIEYAVPKQARVIHAGDPQEPFVMQISSQDAKL